MIQFFGAPSGWSGRRGEWGLWDGTAFSSLLWVVVPFLNIVL